jgi:hypothetical protein
LVDHTWSFQYDEFGRFLLDKDKSSMPSLNPSKSKKNESGQSFVELSLVVIFLMLFVAGIVEFGFLLNNYLNLVDASREAVRYSSDFDPFRPGCDRTDPGCLDMQFFEDTFNLTLDVMDPVTLDAAKGDDVVISFFSVGNGVYRRFPDNDGWSANKLQVSRLTDTEIQSRLDSGAPPTGVLLIEIFYYYPQVLKLPIFTAFVRDPMPVYVYAIMPLSAAEPEPTPIP